MNPILIGYFPRRQSNATPGQSMPKLPHVTEIASVAHYTSAGPPNWVDQWRHNEIWFFDSEALVHKVIADAIQIEIVPDPQRDPPWRVKLNRERGRSYDFYAYKMFPCCFVDGRQEAYDLSGLNCEVVRLPVEKFDLYAFKILPVRFSEENPEDLTLLPLRISPVPADYLRLGYDAVGWDQCNPFRCSPLVCNLEANQRKVNRYCLFDELEPAIELAERYSGTGWQAVWPNSGHCAHSPYCVVEVWRKLKPFVGPPRRGSKFEWPADLLQCLVQHKLGHGGVFEK